MVFLDGLHTYQGVLDDIQHFTPLVRAPGGILMFNDYQSRMFPGVTQAVQEYVARTNASLVVGTRDKTPGAGNAAVVMR